uniref:Basic proline-rich protein n=1 Tax=Nonomuraea gerenzanensis TaxID=93944 RepID=A0A1M4E789_9ACTN|nr:Basic proline-rich protein precursor [Nonomuraea gerenzanensis]
MRVPRGHPGQVDLGTLPARPGPVHGHGQLRALQPVAAPPPRHPAGREGSHRTRRRGGGQPRANRPRGSRRPCEARRAGSGRPNRARRAGSSAQPFRAGGLARGGQPLRSGDRGEGGEPFRAGGPDGEPLRAGGPGGEPLRAGGRGRAPLGGGRDGGGEPRRHHGRNLDHPLNHAHHITPGRVTTTSAAAQSPSAQPRRSRPCKAHR